MYLSHEHGLQNSTNFQDGFSHSKNPSMLNFTHSEKSSMHDYVHSGKSSVFNLQKVTSVALILCDATENLRLKIRPSNMAGIRHNPSVI